MRGWFGHPNEKGGGGSLDTPCKLLLQETVIITI